MGRRRTGAGAPSRRCSTASCSTRFYAAVKSVAPSDAVIAAGVAPNGEPAGVGRMAPVTFLRGLLVPGRRRRASLRLPRPAAFRRARLPSAVRRRPRPPGGLLAGRRDLRRRQGHDLLAARRAPAHGAAARAQAGVGHRAQLGKRPASPARRARRACRRSGSRAPCTGCGSRASASSTGSSWSTPTPASRWPPRRAARSSTRGPPASTAPGSSAANPTRAARPKPFLRGFTLPFDPLRVDRGHVRVWALLMRPGQPVAAATPGAGRRVADDRPPARRPATRCSTRSSPSAAR